ncbi:MAG: zeta toxin family protein [Reyranellaceae bacterium]
MERRPTAAIRLPNLVLLAGPNGSGKSTFAKSALRDVAQFDVKIDADEIARHLSSNDPASVAFAAGKKAISLRLAALAARQSLVIETTLSSNELFRFAREAKSTGYTFIFVYLFIASVDLCDFRVKQRVMKGGHSIPIDVITRRHRRSIVNFDRFFGLSHEALVYNAELEQPQLVASKQDGTVKVHDEFGWAELGIAIQDASHIE